METSAYNRCLDGEFEQVVFSNDRDVGLRSIIAIHSTRLGPSLGGCRFYDYQDEESALRDVLNLAQAMTYKASLAHLPLGGGKAVILGDPSRAKTPALLTSYARFVDRLAGAYITTEDSGTSPADMDIVRKTTRHVTGTSSASGDPSPNTALGVAHGIRAAVRFAFGRDDLSGRKIAIQGVGHVGLPLAAFLKEMGADLVVSDRNRENVERVVRTVGAEATDPSKILFVPCDVLAPCAMGAVLTAEVVSKLQCKIVAGAANNQLASEEVGRQLLERGIVYAPDFAINAGGLMSVGQEIVGYGLEESRKRATQIFDTITTILKVASDEKVPPATIAIRMARERLQVSSSPLP